MGRQGLTNINTPAVSRLSLTLGVTPLDTIKTIGGILAFLAFMYVCAELKHSCATGNLFACVVS